MRLSREVEQLKKKKIKLNKNIKYNLKRFNSSWVNRDFI